MLDFDADPREHPMQIVAAPRIPIRSRQPAIPEALAAVIHKALENSPEDRYPDVIAFRNSLRSFAK